jgi:hypothetical protein
MKTPHVHAELIKAWADGAEIEWFDESDQEWWVSSNPSWSELRKFRIKPEQEPELGGHDVFFPIGITRPTAEEVSRKPEQEPVAWKLESGQAIWFGRTDPEAASALPPDVTMTPLYTTPPQRQPLTSEQVKALLTEAGYDTATLQERADFITGMREAEAAHGIKE